MKFPVRVIAPTSLILLAALAAVFVSHQRQADAAVFLVTKFTDTADNNCNADCSLREAVIAANADPTTADVIALPAGTYQFTLGGVENASAAGDLDITGDVTINGASAATTIIDAGNLDAVLSALSGTVTISGVTLRNGAANYGGGVYNNATLNLTNSVVSGNYAYGFAGGINNTGNMTLTNSTVSGNQAFGETGGVLNNFGTMTITNSTISGNTSGYSNGGLTNYNNGTLTITGSTISGNTAGGGAGGIYNGSGTMTVTNSTISGNTAGSSGGGLYTEATTSLVNVTITNNTADSDGNGSGDGGGIYIPWWATGSVKNTIIAGNLDLGGGTYEPDCHAAPDSGGLSSAGNNLIENTAGCTISGDTASNVTGQGPNLAPLTDNTGPTRTHALLAGSPAIDFGSADCPPPGTDQRGVARPQGNRCDIGAYESSFSGPTPQPTPSPTPTPIPTPTPAGTATPTPTATATATATPALTATPTHTPTSTGSTTTPTPTPTPTGTATPTPTAPPGGPLWGDVDCNGSVTSVDSLKILRYVAQLPSGSPGCPDIGAGANSLFGDVDCGGAVNSVDALKILRYVGGLPVSQSDPCPDIGTAE